MAADETEVPLLRIVRGDPTDHEVAAVALVLLASAGADASTLEKPVSGRWNDRARAVRAPLRAAPGAWSRSYR